MRKQRAPKTLPTFASEDEECAFWDEHDPSEYFTERADIVIAPRLRLRRSLRPPPPASG